MTHEQLIEEAKQYIDSLDADELVALWNDVAMEHGLDDDLIYSTDEIDDLFGEMLPSELFRRIDVKHFNIVHPWMQDSIYGLRSLEDRDIIDAIDVQLVVDYVIEYDLCEDEE